MSADNQLAVRDRSYIYFARERARNQILLLKPRVMSLVVFTGAVGYLLAPVPIDWLQLAITLTAMAGGAGGCGALNMWWDADIDGRMARTAGRPIPRGVVDAREALLIGALLSALSVLALLLLVNWLSAILLALTIAIYVPIYTIWLKRRTPFNIVIGGASGALPPVIGWAAASSGLALEPLVLFAVILVWTPPHFWSLALCRRSDYERAGIPMLPNVAGAEATCRQILLYCVLLVAVSLLLPLFFGSLVTTAIIAGFDCVLIARAMALYWLRRGPEDRLRKAAMALFGFSILYIFAVFLAMLVRL